MIVYGIRNLCTVDLETSTRVVQLYLGLARYNWDRPDPRFLDGPGLDGPGTVRDQWTVQTAGLSGFWTVQTVRTVQDRGPNGLQVVQTAKKRREMRYMLTFGYLSLLSGFAG